MDLRVPHNYEDSYHPLENSCMAPGPLTATDMAATINIMGAQHSIALWAIVFSTHRAHWTTLAALS